MGQRIIPRKWTLKAGGRQMVFVKGLHNESSEHVIMKALLWALYLPHYPNVTVEVPIGDRYKPDLVALDETGKPRFWGESGKVGEDKIVSLGKRYRETHFAIAKWSRRLEPVEAQVRDTLDGVARTAPFDLLSFPPDSLERFFSRDGDIRVGFEDVTWLRLEPSSNTHPKR